MPSAQAALQDLGPAQRCLLRCHRPLQFNYCPICNMKSSFFGYRLLGISLLCFLDRIRHCGTPAGLC